MTSQNKTLKNSFSILVAVMVIASSSLAEPLIKANRRKKDAATGQSLATTPQPSSSGVRDGTDLLPGVTQTTTTTQTTAQTNAQLQAQITAANAQIAAQQAAAEAQKKKQQQNMILIGVGAALAGGAIGALAMSFGGNSSSTSSVASSPSSASPASAPASAPAPVAVQTSGTAPVSRVPGSTPAAVIEKPDPKPAAEPVPTEPIKKDETRFGDPLPKPQDPKPAAQPPAPPTPQNDPPIIKQPPQGAPPTQPPVEKPPQNDPPASLPPVTDDLFKAPGNPPPSLIKCLTAVDVQFYDYHGKLTSGRFVVNKDLAQDVKDIFQTIKDIKFPVASANPINDKKYNWSDDASMAVDNSSAFNFRRIEGRREMSMHALGRAIDINPKCNPMIKNGKMSPPNGGYSPGDACTFSDQNPKGKQIIEAFKAKGWTWGGKWTSLKDYQHFEKPGSAGQDYPYCEEQKSGTGMRGSAGAKQNPNSTR